MTRRLDPSDPVYQAAADTMLLEHSARCGRSSVMLSLLAEEDPERWGRLVDKMQETIERAYRSGRLDLLAAALAQAERTYRQVAADWGLEVDP